MSTGIYVYEPTTVRIETSAEGQLQIARMDGDHDVATHAKSATVTLQPGVYRVSSTAAIKVTAVPTKGISISATPTFETIETRLYDKDTWPDPPPRLGLTKDSVRQFFMGKSLDLAAATTPEK